MSEIVQSTITFQLVHRAEKYVDGMGLSQLVDACARGEMVGGNLTISTSKPLSAPVLNATAASLQSDSSLLGDNLDGEYDSPSTMSPPWLPADAIQALMEGWNIMHTPGSVGGDWQVQRMDDSSDTDGGAQLDDDDEAMALVVNGAAAHHVAARAFLLAHNEPGFQEVMSFHAA